MEAKILVGDVRSRLAEISDKSVQCVVTSPPYWGLRDYGTATWTGGTAECTHRRMSKKSASGFQNKVPTSDGLYKKICKDCGAERVDNQMGLEQTPLDYVAQLVKVFREVRRVLKDDGVLWLNLGDTYNGAKVGNTNENVGAKRHATDSFAKPLWRDLKPKDLVGIPWRVAFALQDDGWYLRQDIIWAKPNPMPESVTDRCTKSHEHIFMLTKNAKYYFDNQAIKEPSANLGKTKIKFGGTKYGDSDDPKHATKSGNEYTDTGLRNKRDVWTIPVRPFKEAHFAVMPEAIVEPCILASSRPADTVLDPFTGSGTVAVVSLRHNRNFIGTELSPEYAQIALNRIKDANPLINTVTVDALD